MVAIGLSDFLLSYKGYYLLRVTIQNKKHLIITEVTTQYKDKNLRKISGFELLKTGIENMFFKKPPDNPGSLQAAF